MVKRSLDFRKSANGSYEAFYNNSSIGVSFFIPDQYTIDDYKDKIAYLDSGIFNSYLNIKDEELDGVKDYSKYKEISKVKEIVKNSVKQRDSFNEVTIL